MNSSSLDTNVLLRWLIKDIPEQSNASEKLIGSGRTLHVSDIAINEVVYVLEKGYGMTRQQVADSLRAIITVANINCNKQLFTQVLPVYISAPKLSFADICLAFYTELSNAKPLYTFDRALAKHLPKSVKLLS